MLLRVLSVRDAREWLLPLPEGAQEIQVAELKRLVRAEQQTAASAAAPCSEGEAFVVFRGRLLPDMDFFDLNALATTDFLVFAEEEPPPPDDGDDDDVDGDDTGEQEQKAADGAAQQHSRKRKKREHELDAPVQQLAAMGFVAAQARDAVRQSGGDLAAAIALLTGDASAAAIARRHRDGSVARAHPELRVLEPALGELEALGVRRVAAADGFQAVMRLKEFAPDEALAQLNAHPEELPPVISERSANAEDDADVIDRLASIGFDRDLVAAVYESCGKQEETTLNALCEMLH
ncbi:hypothetical protein PybrP1_001383 [[Pythium] brassicae (nom. inval.)]|nr:hypothetical protein PybrP1_001383 [[Pythium] brassicae (nom. inval.)]